MKLTEVEAKIWVETYHKAESEAQTLLACAAWALHSLEVLRKNALGVTENIIDFETGKAKNPGIKPWPDSQMRNFQALGKDLDLLCNKLNKLLPEGEE